MRSSDALSARTVNQGAGGNCQTFREVRGQRESRKEHSRVERRVSAVVLGGIRRTGTVLEEIWLSVLDKGIE